MCIAMERLGPLDLLRSSEPSTYGSNVCFREAKLTASMSASGPKLPTLRCV